MMAAVLRLIGVPKAEVVKWALHQANRQRLTDLIRTARGLPAAEKDGGVTERNEQLRLVHDQLGSQARTPRPAALPGDQPGVWRGVDSDGAGRCGAVGRAPRAPVRGGG